LIDAAASVVLYLVVVCQSELSVNVITGAMPLTVVLWLIVVLPFLPVVVLLRLVVVPFLLVAVLVLLVVKPDCLKN
jgi:hypothetical protein